MRAFRVAAATTRLRKVHIGTGPASPIGDCADGTLRWMLTRKRAFELSGGKRFLVGVIADISEIKAGEAALRASEPRAHRLALVANRTGNAVIVTDADGRIEWVNDGFTQLTGYAFAEAAGSLVSVLLHGPDTAADTVTRFRTQLLAGNSVQDEILQYTKAGRPLWVAADIQGVNDAQGKLASIVILESDMTARKQAEQALRDAKEAAAAASRAKSEFVANMSHEIRTPMNGVLGMLELLRASSLDQTQRRFAETADASARSLLGIIDDILDFSKIEAGKLDLEHIAFDSAYAVGEAVALFEARADAKGLRLHLAVADDPPPAEMGDPLRLRQVITNLVGNAIKFTAAGEVGAAQPAACEAVVAEAMAPTSTVMLDRARLDDIPMRDGNALEWPLEVARAQDLYDAAAVLLLEEIEDVVA